MPLVRSTFWEVIFARCMWQKGTSTFLPHAPREDYFPERGTDEWHAVRVRDRRVVGHDLGRRRPGEHGALRPPRAGCASPASGSGYARTDPRGGLADLPRVLPRGADAEGGGAARDPRLRHARGLSRRGDE